MGKLEIPMPELLLFTIKGEIDEDLSLELKKSIAGVNLSAPRDEITIEIDSEGGIVDEVISLAEFFQRVTNPIRTVAQSNCFSAAVLLVAAGDKGKRLAWDTCEFMIHPIQIDTHLSGSARETSGISESIRRLNDRYLNLIAQFTGQSMKKIKRDSSTEYYMSADQALRYGIIDAVIPRLKQR